MKKIEVDMAGAVAQSEQRYASDIRAMLREEKLRYRSITRRWYGKVFQFDLLGPPRRDWLIGWVLLIPSALLAFGAFAGLMVPPARRPAVK